MVNLSPAVLFVGPPHTGKSVLFYHLTYALRDLGVSHYAMRVSPDGEGNWFHEGDPDTVSKIRVYPGRIWPDILVQRMSQDLQHRSLPLLVDIGSNPTLSPESLFRLCTHVILLLRTDGPEDTQHWEHFVAENNLLPLARLFSERRGASVVTNLSPVLEGTLTGLDRHAMQADPGPVFKKLVEHIATLFTSYDLHDMRRTLFECAPTSLVLDLGTQLNAFTTISTRWEPAMLPGLLERTPAHTPLSVYGVGPNWLYAALAAHADEQPFYLFDPKLPIGWIQPASLFLGSTNSRDVDIEPVVYQDFTILKVAFPADRLEYFQPDPLAFPPLSTERGLVINGRIPHWLLTALVRLYKDVGVPWIALFYAPLNAAVVAYSRTDTHRPGDSLPISSL